MKVVNVNNHYSRFESKKVEENDGSCKKMISGDIFSETGSESYSTST